ncbi:hypothetical protein Pst134EA_015597 [Puccinia striiformis f. sp. tritici]|uniref:hypothetical protein n=1 Tax=Puccinia striiformis f. sp. tritici TaxID=168172 RepID=UPI002007CC4E|nr:hypothetical protein Pst134EA_015597 [Puccinia striiformis f. sp. tritici]KAH9463507.1 hypothetical protein Pst134EA_015597 [Puccinia striiformis f. sp. tritici]
MLAQTTDSGSNNNTMASTMYELFDLYSDGQSTWDPTSMHIRCACHKFALIVNGGLQAQEIADPDPEVQEVNQLADIPEENEGEEAYKSDYGNADDEGSHTESESEVHPDDKEEAEPPQAQSVNTNERTSRSDPAQTGSARHIKSAKLRALTDQFVAGCCDQADHSLRRSTESLRANCKEHGNSMCATVKPLRFASLQKAPFFRSEAVLRFPVHPKSESAAPDRYASLKNSGSAALPGAQKRKRSARIALSLPESASGSGAAHHTTLVALLKSLPRFLCAAAPRIGSAHAALLALSAAAVLHIPLLRQLAFPSALPSNHLQTIIPPCPYPMASEKLPDDVPSTPPNTSKDPSVPQSTRRKSSRIHTPISRPGFIRTASDSRRALIGIPNEQHRRPSITADSHPVTEDPRGGTKSNDEEVEPQATSQRRVTKKVASKVHQVSKRTGKGIEVDLAQDSDDEHSQLAAKKDKTKDSRG